MKIPITILNRMIIHAREEAPIEACGMLAGNNGIVRRHYRMTNRDASAEHFTLEPREQFSLIKIVRSEKFSILGVYHSHPATPARPSQEDIKLAFDPSISYVIISLAEKDPVAKSFLIKDGKVDIEPIEIINDEVEDYDEYSVVGRRI